MKPFGFIPFFTIKMEGDITEEYIKNFVTVTERKNISNSRLYAVGFFAAILNLSRPLFMGLIVDNLIQRELKGAYLYITLFTVSRLLMWVNNLSFDYVSSKASQRILQKEAYRCIAPFFLITI